MTEKTAIIIFGTSWFLLLFIAILAQILFTDKPKKTADFATNIMVIAPFLLVFGLFYLRRYIGGYESPVAVRITGVCLVVLAMAGYTSAHFFLRRNWSLSASIKEGHSLIKSGPYKYVRHPMYSSMTLMVLGSGLLMANYLMILSTPMVGIIYYIRAKKEEVLLREEFSEYAQYAKETRMFIPGIL